MPRIEIKVRELWTDADGMDDCAILTLVTGKGNILGDEARKLVTDFKDNQIIDKEYSLPLFKLPFKWTKKQR